MSIKTRIHWIELALPLSILWVSGCGTGEQSETLFEPSHTPSLAHVGTAVEITVDESIGCFYGHSLEGDVLIGLTRQAGQAQPAVVSLTTGDAHQLNVEGIQFPNDTVHYVAQVRDRDPHTDYAELVVYDLRQGRSIYVTEGRLGGAFTFGSLVVWEEVMPETRDIYGYDLVQGQRFTVTVREKGAPIAPQVSEDWVVYLFYPPGENSIPQLRAFQISTQDDFEIGLMPMQPGDYAPRRFRISGSRVAWIGVKRKEIHVYDLETRTDEIIFKDESPYQVILGGLDLEGDIVMWGGPLPGYVGYDLLYRQMFDIPDLPEEVSVSNAFISARYVVWETEESHSLSDYVLTPWPTGEPRPTLPPELVAEAEAETCRRKLFVAPIIR